MEKWSSEMKTERYPRNTSFSSALLDAIYRSTDDDVGASLCVCRKTMNATTTATVMHDRTNRNEYNTKQTPRPFKWTTDEKKAAEKRPPRRNVSELGVFDATGWYRLNSRSNSSRANSSTASSSSESSGFSSSEADSVLSPTEKKLAAKESQYEQKSRPPPVIIPPKKHHPIAAPDFFANKKTEEPEKSRGARVSKLYNELKKAKQPISPGSRIAGFLNSLFAAAKKAKRSSATTTLNSPSKPPSSLSVDTFKRPASRSSSMAPTTTMTPSSRSCLSKTPSTRGDGMKRSVRFFPMSVTVGEDSRPRGRKCLYEELLSSPLPLPRKDVKVKDLIAEYQMKSSTAAGFLFDLSPSSKPAEDEDYDASSCSSSDLFELENLTELPVYETTSLETNRAIAKGLIL
ncbi:BIG GRAIN 1-like A protein [Nymphaea thermarum]|nr:BIG GRAIN 1-like A protein [Nymphaea thermarum]